MQFQEVVRMFDSNDLKEAEEYLEETVLQELILLSNTFQDYKKAISIVDRALKALVVVVGQDKKQMIENAANRAGERFVKQVQDAKLVECVKKRHFVREIWEGRCPFNPVVRKEQNHGMDGKGKKS